MLRPDPRLISTPDEFARALRVLRARAGFSIRELGRVLEQHSGDTAASSTLGGWQSGSHLPTPKLVPVFVELLAVCGVADPVEVEHWLAALDRVRQPPGRRPVGSAPRFRGLQAYEPEHARYFRGREGLTEDLVALARRPHQHGSVIIAVGPSGSGKSSLLRAGLIPALEAAEPHAVKGTATYLLFTPGRNPVRELARQLARLTDDAAPEIEARLLADPGTCPDFAAGTRPLLLVVDQFEELFTACKDEALRTTFIDALCAAASQTTATAADASADAPQPLIVALGMRADFYAHAARYARLVPVLQNAQLVVGPMTPEQLRLAFTESAREARLSLGDGLVELLLRELAPTGDSPPRAGHEIGALPLLSHALLMTWEASKGRTLTVEHYLAAGGIRDAIARTAEAAYASLATLEQRAAARRVFTRLVRSGQDTLDTRRRVALTEFVDTDSDTANPARGDDAREVLDQFIVARLITVDEDSVQLIHDAMLTAWPRLRKWLDADQEWLRLHRKLTDDARAWAESGRDPDGLYRGGRLNLLLERTRERDRGLDLNALESEFLERGTAREAQENRRARMRTRRRYQLLVLVTALLLVAAGVLAFALQANDNSNRERVQALSRSLAAEADRLRGQDVSLSMQVALEAYRISPTPEARSSLLDSTDLAADVRVLTPAALGPARTVAVSSDGRLLAVGTKTGAVQLYATSSAGTPAPLGAPLTGPTDSTVTAAFTSDAHLLAAAGNDGKVYLWQTADPAHPHALAPLTGSGAAILSLAITRDGRLLAAAGEDKSVHLWNISDPTNPVALPPLTGATGSVNAVAFNRSGTILAAGGSDNTLRLWDVARSTLLSATSTHAGHVFSLAFSYDGSTLAIGTGASHTTLTWDVTTPTRPAPSGPALAGPTDWVNYVAFSPDGKTLAAASSDDLLWLYDLGTRRPIAELSHPHPVTRTAFLGNGSLLTVAYDGVVRMWTIPGPLITGAKDAIFSVTYDANGNELGIAPGGNDNTVSIWHATDPQRPAQLGPALADAPDAPEYSGSGTLTPDGHTFIVGDTDGTIQLWDTSDPANPRRLGQPVSAATDQIESVAVTGDGRTIAVSSDDGTVRLLSLANRAKPALLATLKTDATEPVYQAVFNPADNLVAAASTDEHVYLWDISNRTSPRRLAKLGGFTSAGYTVAFNHDGRILAGGSADHTVRLWDVSNPGNPTSLGQPLTGPVATVYSVAFAPHSDLLAVGDIDASIWLCDLSAPANPVNLATLSGATKGVLSVAFSPDGHTLAAGSFDHTVRLWNTDPDMAATWICTHVGTPITPAEWSQYLPGLAYAPPCA